VTLHSPRPSEAWNKPQTTYTRTNIVALAGKQAGSLTPGFRLSIVSLISSLLATSGRQLVKIFLPKVKYFTDINPIFWQLPKQNNAPTQSLKLLIHLCTNN
jgi:hypothetical protein